MPGFGGGADRFEFNDPILFFSPLSIYSCQLYPGTQLTCVSLQASEISSTPEPLYIYIVASVSLSFLQACMHN